MIDKSQGRIRPYQLDDLYRICLPGLTWVHLRVRQANRRAAGFYRHVGFAELPTDDDVHIFTMNLRA